ncbi:MAG: RICIN domain-containing protein, partial [Deltaproteobacteria bacterium]|nr:RICIN domain-containing protein [Deltaproteobacteria bacterium]
GGGPLDPGFDQWSHRMYPVRSVSGGAGSLRFGGQCLQASGSAEGSAVLVAACSAGASQTWIVGANSRVSFGSTGLCLGVGSNGTSAVIETCNGAASDQIWTLLDNGQLRGALNACLTVSGTAVSTASCLSDMTQTRFSPPASQRWNL